MRDLYRLDSVLTKTAKLSRRVRELEQSRADAEWKEGDHPREEDGKFGSGGGGGGGGSGSIKQAIEGARGKAFFTGQKPSSAWVSQKLYEHSPELKQARETAQAARKAASAANTTVNAELHDPHIKALYEKAAAAEGAEKALLRKLQKEVSSESGRGTPAKASAGNSKADPKGKSLTEFSKEFLGPNWVVAKNTSGVRARYGEDVNTITQDKYAKVVETWAKANPEDARRHLGIGADKYFK